MHNLIFRHNESFDLKGFLKEMNDYTFGLELASAVKQAVEGDLSKIKAFRQEVINSGDTLDSRMQRAKLNATFQDSPIAEPDPKFEAWKFYCKRISQMTTLGHEDDKKTHSLQAANLYHAMMVYGEYALGGGSEDALQQVVSTTKQYRITQDSERADAVRKSFRAGRWAGIALGVTGFPFIALAGVGGIIPITHL